MGNVSAYVDAFTVPCHGSAPTSHPVPKAFDLPLPGAEGASVGCIVGVIGAAVGSGVGGVGAGVGEPASGVGTGVGDSVIDCDKIVHDWKPNGVEQPQQLRVAQSASTEHELKLGKPQPPSQKPLVTLQVDTRVSHELACPQNAEGLPHCGGATYGTGAGEGSFVGSAGIGE